MLTERALIREGELTAIWSVKNNGIDQKIHLSLTDYDKQNDVRIT
jgi:hypothetical protein